MKLSRKERNAAQRQRQQALRDQAKRERKPSRDDIARALLHWSITGSAAKGQMETLFRVEDEIVARLVGQGFDEGKAYEVFDDLIERYTKRCWEFRRKVHLTPPLLLKTAFAYESCIESSDS
ncbi:hypothetical protein JQ506_23020 [Shinella sp. PSBB067]|uniref:hypothetical protein n=1 Tax=Shinella sp. PSBB067 TaxID=2715959 RepID=UPI00193BBAEC|nr:hypothetical protein [Shinella sp. PSBB067]QRI63632.1 hypothetical protein JQ506_23020 [Shinella sp. PSBB067]